MTVVPRLRLFALAFFFLSASLVTAQTPRDSVRFRWTKVERDKKSGKVRLGWTFENPTSTPVTFAYRLKSDLGEIATGLMTLPARQERMGGGLFSGDRIAVEEILPSPAR